MLNFINGIYNETNTIIETNAAKAAQAFTNRGDSARLVLMQPKPASCAVLKQNGIDQTLVVSIFDWLQEIPQKARPAVKISWAAYQAKRLDAAHVDYYDQGRLAVKTAIQNGALTATYVDAAGIRLEADVYDAQGYLNHVDSFGPNNQRTSTTWLNVKGAPALIEAYDAAQKPVMFQVPKWQIIAQSQTQLWSALLRHLTAPGDVVISMRREYDEAVLGLPENVAKVAGVYHSQPQAPQAFDLITKTPADVTWLAHLK